MTPPSKRALVAFAATLPLAACSPDGDHAPVASFCEAPAHYFHCGMRNMAHRGGSKLAPEDTLAAFENANALGVDVLEMDLHSTADGEIVVLHDDTVDRTTEGSGPVTSFTLDDLQSLDAAYHFSLDGGATFPWRGTGVVVPTLDAVLAALKLVRTRPRVRCANKVLRRSTSRSSGRRPSRASARAASSSSSSSRRRSKRLPMRGRRSCALSWAHP